MTASARPVTVVTGGGRGIGAATVRHLARAGHDLVVGHLDDTAAAQRVVADARAAGARALAVRGDVVDDDTVERLFAAATLGSPHEYVHYAPAKAGLDALTVGLAKKLAGQGVRVNGVAPGLVRTGIHAAAGDPDRLVRALPRIPLGRAGEPEEIAPAVAWLLGPEASYVTGTTIRVAGGL